ncbi:MAG: hypothetical protein RLZ51_1900 [Pseudomonadota bacterium]|jgi:hypothetical protein
MSTIRVNTILDASGGNTVTINGKTPIALADVPAPTTAQVLTATASAAAQAVGTYAFCATSGVGSTAGATIAGSSLRLSDSRDTQGGTLSGTWLNVGGTVVAGAAATLFLRVS